MSNLMTKYNIKTICINDIPDNIQYSSRPITKVISTTTTTYLDIYSFNIGSATNLSYVESHDPQTQRNHEFPQFAENLLYNPLSQMSPNFIQSLNLLPNSNLIIRHKIFLIDSYYAIDSQQNPIGLLNKISHLPTDLKINHNISNDDNIIITVILEPIVVPEYITEEQLLHIIGLLDKLGETQTILLNIMDCSSRVALNLYADSLDNNIKQKYKNISIHITQPQCLIIDRYNRYMPIITLLDMNKHDDDTKNIYKYRKLHVRWVNYESEHIQIPDLIIKLEFCPISANMYNFLKDLYKQYTINVSLFTLFKLLGYLSYTNNHSFNINNGIGLGTSFGIRTNPAIFMSSNIITVNFNSCDFTFSLFAEYWNKYQEFRNLAIFNPGWKIDELIINKYITFLVNKYTNITGISYLGLDPNIMDIVILEARVIFKTLSMFFPENQKYYDMIKLGNSQNDNSGFDTGCDTDCDKLTMGNNYIRKNIKNIIRECLVENGYIP